MVITGQSYIVPISFSPQLLITNIKKTLDYIANINSTIFNDLDNINSLGNKITKDQGSNAINQFNIYKAMKLDRIYNEFKKIKRSAREFIKNRFGPNQPIHNRQKRGVFNFMGEISNILFGTATERQINELHQTFSQQNEINKMTFKQLNIHSTVLNKTIADLASLHNIANKTNEALYLISKAQEETSDSVLKMQILLAIFPELEINLNVVRGDYQNLINGLNDFLNSYPSTHIIPDSLFSNLLASAAERGNGLLFPHNSNNIGLFRETSTIFSRHIDENSIMFFLAIPLASHTYGIFDVYTVHSVPLPIPNSTQFMEYIPDAKYFAVSEDTDRFTQFDDLSNCIKHMNTLICHPHSPIMNAKASNCLYNIFTSKQFNTCKKVITSKFPPKFIRVSHGFIYATDEQLTLRAKCGPDTRIFHIQNSGFLKLSDECSVSSETFSTPSHMTMHANQVEIPLMTDMFTYTVPETMKSIYNPRIADIISSINSDMPVSLTTAVSHLQLLKHQELQQSKVTSWESPLAYTTPGSAFSIGTSTIIFIILAFGIFIYFRNPIFQALRDINSNMIAPRGRGALEEGTPVVTRDIHQAMELLAGSRTQNRAMDKV